MIEGRHDITIFGATGFTGHHIVKYLINRKQTENQFSLAIAGRSEKRLIDLKNSMNEEKIDIIVADVLSPQSLFEMCKKTKVLINATGPYRYYGEQVVTACINAGCDYVDICGEPQFIESCFLKFNERAREAGISIVSACGFDSVPADIGHWFTAKQFVSPKIPGFIESVVSIESSERVVVHMTTFEALVESLLDEKSLSKIRAELKPKLTPIKRSCPAPKMLREMTYRDGKYWAKFPGADAAVVRLSQHIVAEKEPELIQPHYRAYFATNNWISMVAIGIWFLLLSFFLKIGLSRFILKWGEFFTCGLFKRSGPSQKQVEAASFSMVFKARGFSSQASSIPDSVINTRITGPELGYAFTSLSVGEAAITTLLENSTIPKGVLTPSAAFRETTFIDRLEASGVHFEVL